MYNTSTHSFGVIIGIVSETGYTNMTCLNNFHLSTLAWLQGRRESPPSEQVSSALNTYKMDSIVTKFELHFME